MQEIADTLREVGIPPEFHLAAAEVYRRLGSFKDASEIPSLEAVLNAMLIDDNR
jgi:hypothetical protein